MNENLYFTKNILYLDMNVSLRTIEKSTIKEDTIKEKIVCKKES